MLVLRYGVNVLLRERSTGLTATVLPSTLFSVLSAHGAQFDQWWILGQGFGPLPGSNDISNYRPGFRYYAAADGLGDGLAWVQFEPVHQVCGKIDDDLTQSGTVGFDLYGEGPEASSPLGYKLPEVRDITIPPTGYFEDGDKGFATLTNGYWYFTHAEKCPELPEWYRLPRCYPGDKRNRGVLAGARKGGWLFMLVVLGAGAATECR